jgi:hypothetical protein
MCQPPPLPQFIFTSPVLQWSNLLRVLAISRKISINTFQHLLVSFFTSCAALVDSGVNLDCTDRLFMMLSQMLAVNTL